MPDRKSKGTLGSIFSGEPYFPEPPYEGPEHQTCSRETGVTPDDDEGWESWRPLGVSPAPDIYGNTRVIWERKRFTASEPSRGTAFGTIFAIGLLSLGALATRKDKKQPRKPKRPNRPKRTREADG